MPATLERTVTFDSRIARRAERKMRRYGHSFDDAVNAALESFVSRRGDPFADDCGHETREVPGKRLLASFREAELMEQGLIPAKSYTDVRELLADCLK